MKLYQDSRSLFSAAQSALVRVSAVVIVAIVLAGCGAALPSLGDIFPAFAPPTATPTPPPTPTPTPQPTPTPKPGETPLPATATPAPTPQVSIPPGYGAVVDSQRGYSLALPSGWTELDLRGSQVAQLAGLVGQGEALAQLQEFLDTGAGQAVGTVAITDLGAAMFGGFPTLLNVSVVDAPAATPDSVLEFLTTQLQNNSSMLGDIAIEGMNTVTINNMPGVFGSAVADLSGVGINVKIFVKVAGLIANDKVYVLTAGTQESSRGTKEPEFDTIIGTFRPE